ncbi:cardiolipin synthase (CMP-forming) [Azospirillaceae bacterium]
MVSKRHVAPSEVDKGRCGVCGRFIRVDASVWLLISRMSSNSSAVIEPFSGHMLKHLPNLLTLSRIAIIPIVIGLLMAPASSAWAAWAALFLYVAACVTDWLDGYLARAWGQTSAVGRFLDPIADKMLVSATLFMLVPAERLSGWSVIPAVVILLREVLISGLREFLAGEGVSVPVSRLAKWKTAVQMSAIALLILGPHGSDILWKSGALHFYLWLAAFLTVVTGASYLVTGVRRMMAEDQK